MRPTRFTFGDPGLNCATILESTWTTTPADYKQLSLTPMPLGESQNDKMSVDFGWMNKYNTNTNRTRQVRIRANGEPRAFLGVIKACVVLLEKFRRNPRCKGLPEMGNWHVVELRQKIGKQMTFEFVFTVRWCERIIRSHDACSKDIDDLLESISLEDGGAAQKTDTRWTPFTSPPSYEQHTTSEYRPPTPNSSEEFSDLCASFRVPETATQCSNRPSPLLENATLHPFYDNHDITTNTTFPELCSTSAIPPHSHDLPSRDSRATPQDSMAPPSSYLDDPSLQGSECWVSQSSAFEPHALSEQCTTSIPRSYPQGDFAPCSSAAYPAVNFPLPFNMEGNVSLRSLQSFPVGGYLEQLFLRGVVIVQRFALFNETPSELAGYPCQWQPPSCVPEYDHY